VEDDQDQPSSHAEFKAAKVMLVANQAGATSKRRSMFGHRFSFSALMINQSCSHLQLNFALLAKIQHLIIYEEDYVGELRCDLKFKTFASTLVRLEIYSVKFSDMLATELEESRTELHQSPSIV